MSRACVVRFRITTIVSPPAGNNTVRETVGSPISDFRCLDTDNDVRGGRQASDAEHALAHWAAGRQMNGGRDGLVDCGRIHKSLATRSVRKTLFKPGTSNAGWRHLMWYTQGEPTASESSGASGPPRSCTARWHL